MSQEYKCRNPVLLRIFRRPNETEQVVNVLRKVQPDKLYIAGDGPRGLSACEDSNVFLAREVALNLGWDCETFTLFMSENLGGPKCGFESISWFFSKEEQGIILEDDTVPNVDFFKFCDDLLDLYKDEHKVVAVTGNNFQNGRMRGEASYYFSKFPHIWGWATWRRAWAKASLELDFWPEWKDSEDWSAFCDDAVLRKYWSPIFDAVASGERVHWDYAWTAACWFHKGVVATPNVNLVRNIGFGPNASNTCDGSDWRALNPVADLYPIKHPANILIDTEADRYVLDHVFGGKRLRFPKSLYYSARRIAGFCYRKLKGLSPNARIIYTVVSWLSRGKVRACQFVMQTFRR